MVTRRCLLHLVPALIGGGVAGCGVQTAPTPVNTSPRTPAAQTYRYGDLPSQFAELTLPVGSAQVPVVVVLHGGFWLTAYGLELGRPLVADLVPRGWATLNVEYRRVGQSADTGGGGWPQTGTDVAAAVDALMTHGQDVAGGRLDLDNVVALGHSAGGQLAGWLAARPGLPPSAPGSGPRVRLRGFVAQAGVLDLVGAAAEGVGGTAVSGLMGGGPTGRAEAYRVASPLARVPLGVPSICVHGTEDNTVPLAQSERFVAAATQAGDQSTLRTFRGSHFDLIDVSTPAWELCVTAVLELLAH